MIIKLLVCFKVKHLSSLHIKITYIANIFWECTNILETIYSA
jgi:hypothetical protein